MTDEPKSATVGDFSSILSQLFKLSPEAEARAAKSKLEAVPAEWADRFTPIGDIMSSPFGGGLSYVPVCNICGAMVYPTALDRHALQHEGMKVLLEAYKAARKPDGL